MTPSGSSRHLAVIALGYGLSTLAAVGLFGPYRAFSGQPALERIIVLFLMPVTATVIWRLIRSLQQQRLPGQENGSADAAIDGIVLSALMFLIGVHVIIVAVLVGATWIQPWAQRATVVLLGLALMAAGNLLPRTRPNMALGIRTSRTLNDRHLWVVTHRITGYTTVLLGAVTVLAGIFLRGTQVAAVPGTALMIATAGLCAFYWKTTRLSDHRRA